MQSVVRRVIVAAATGFVAFLITNLTDQPLIWQLTLSAFLGGVALVVQFLIDFEQRIEGVERGLREHGDRMTALIERRMTGVSQVVDLFEQTSNREELIEFFRNAVQIGPEARLRYDFAHGEIRRMSRLLKELGNGHVSYPAEENEWLLSLTRAARDTIDATSLPSVDAGTQGYEDGFWESEPGLRYLESQQDAVGRGVRIRRIFVLNRSIASDDASLRAVCRQHTAVGVEVRVLPSDLLPSVPPSTVTDFILFDNEVCYQVATISRMDPRGDGRPTIVGTQLVLRDDMVSEHRNHFEQFWDAAQIVPDQDAQPTA
ncbi:phosphatidylserine/phosphatidylglycerophosphate/cardiolipin synthase family protein [Frankia sp. AgB1.9]|uniref:DUF6879 family protein n=1 Tax=Frankia sp. AgB1.9 TaxID=1836968 RepID=UPI001933C33D|nr:DUF6879 family protein [Frankia sp. AgB1.9]MBL7487911.1 phosphatidylserine/phosphatidylglycerophosphate/cardiolipin synthase family protein [Frankia sp. AgW1.1]MBL7549977.1 phosphatidylserine/phosphatidylglycerophosphate/cardiolipin synthase family protein [Frankia sp. AgB1.9]MBL7621445.1 hypothetical protein [Frankia sp. AgB1.8]